MAKNPEEGNERGGKPLINRRNFLIGLAAAAVTGPKIVSEAAKAYEKSEHERNKHEKNSLLANAVVEAKDKSQIVLVAELMKDQNVQKMIDDDKISLHEFRMYLEGKGVIFAFGEDEEAEEILARYRTTVEDNGMDKEAVNENVSNLISGAKQNKESLKIEIDE